MRPQDLPHDDDARSYHVPHFTVTGKLGAAEFRVLADLAQADMVIHRDADGELKRILELFCRLTLANAIEDEPNATRYTITGFGHTVASARA
jgi:hypothetical protein